MEEIFSYIPEDYFGPDDDIKEDKENENENIIKNVVNAINNITKKDKREENKKEEFVPGIIKERYKQFYEYRTNFQNLSFHFLEKDFLDDTKNGSDSNDNFIKSDSKYNINQKYKNIESNYNSNCNDKKTMNISELSFSQKEDCSNKDIDFNIINKKVNKMTLQQIVDISKSD